VQRKHLPFADAEAIHPPYAAEKMKVSEEDLERESPSYRPGDGDAGTRAAPAAVDVVREMGAICRGTARAC